MWPKCEGPINPNDVMCDGCDERIPTSGTRYKCCLCNNYDLCPGCYDNGEHDTDHPFERFDSNTSAGVRLPPRGTGVAVSNVICDGCEENIPICDWRHNCCACPNYNLCAKCYDDGKHDAAHAFRLLHSPTSAWCYLPSRQNGDTHSNIICNGCNKYIPITGRRYKCWECSDYDLCLGCYDAGHHGDDHPFKLFDSSTSSWLDLPSREIPSKTSL